jgi:hypothetical protein
VCCLSAWKELSEITRHKLSAGLRSEGLGVRITPGVLEFLIICPVVVVASKEFPFAPFGLIPLGESCVKEFEVVPGACWLHAGSPL